MYEMMELITDAFIFLVLISVISAIEISYYRNSAGISKFYKLFFRDSESGSHIVKASVTYLTPFIKFFFYIGLGYFLARYSLITDKYSVVSYALATLSVIITASNFFLDVYKNDQFWKGIRFFSKLDSLGLFKRKKVTSLFLLWIYALALLCLVIPYMW